MKKPQELYQDRQSDIIRAHIATWLSNLSVACLILGAFQNDTSEFAFGVSVKAFALWSGLAAMILSVGILQKGRKMNTYYWTMILVIILVFGGYGLFLSYK